MSRLPVSSSVLNAVHAELKQRKQERQVRARIVSVEKREPTIDLDDYEMRDGQD